MLPDIPKSLKRLSLYLILEKKENETYMNEIRENKYEIYIYIYIYIYIILHVCGCLRVYRYIYTYLSILRVKVGRLIRKYTG